LGEAIQRQLPDDAGREDAQHDELPSHGRPRACPGRARRVRRGNDPDARAQVSRWLKEWFGWKAPIDLGDITASRGLEMWLPLWLRIMSSVKTPDFNVQIVR
jgi:predicted dinucleotide-binding enzyme